jgi:hypothetical protein
LACPRRLDPDKHRIAEKEFLAMEKAGIIRQSNSPWASPLHLVPKKDCFWRPCGTYRCLNAVTIPDRYPLPNMQSLNDLMVGCAVFSKIDLVKVYHQIPIANEDIPRRQSGPDRRNAPGPPLPRAVAVLALSKDASDIHFGAVTLFHL